LIVASPILLKLKKPYNYFLISLLGILWVLDYQVFPIIRGWYFISIETIFFFCLGGELAKRSGLLVAIINTSSLFKSITLLVWATLIALRIYIDPRLDIWYVKEYSIGSLLLYKIGIIVGIISLVQISSLLANNKLLIYISSLTFFVYLFHNIPLAHIKIITQRLISDQYSFYLNFPLATILVFLAAHLISKYIPSLYALMSGGRTPNKAIQRIYYD
jgi:hypothetical protein